MIIQWQTCESGVGTGITKLWQLLPVPFFSDLYFTAPFWIRKRKTGIFPLIWMSRVCTECVGSFYRRYSSLLIGNPCRYFTYRWWFRSSMTELGKELRLLFFYYKSRSDERRVKKKTKPYALYVMNKNKIQTLQMHNFMVVKLFYTSKREFTNAYTSLLSL